MIDVKKWLEKVVGLRADTAASGVITGTDTVVALLKQAITQQGLVYFGDVTTYTNATTFASTDLGGRENDYFKNWYVYCVRDAGGAAAAPQHEYRLITDYTGDATGVFVHNAFSAIMAVGDQVMLIHPAIYEILTIRGGAYTIQDLMDEHAANFDYAKNLDTTTMDGTEQAVYDNTSTVPFHVHGVWLGLENMTAGDFIQFKLYMDYDDASIADKVSEDTEWGFGGAQDPKWTYRKLDMLVTYEFKITAKQVGGTNREIYTIVDDGARGS